MNSMRNFFGGGGIFGPLANIANIIQKLSEFARNPLGILLGLGNVSIPQNIGNNPEAMVNHLRNSGQMSQEQFDQFSNLANQLKQFLPRKF